MKKMKRLFATGCLLMLSITSLSLLTGCSDDDGPKLPSRFITQVDVYKNNNGSYEIASRYEFGYDAKKISNVSISDKDQEVTYTYGTNKIEYRWDGVNEDNTTFTKRFESSLTTGRVNIGNLTSTGNFTYFYTPQGYISEAAIGADMRLVYKWGNSSVFIESDPVTYETEYRYTIIDNTYSIDLNVLTQMADNRKDFTLVMNSYGQLAGVLGTRYPYFLEDSDYIYKYSFDENNRLVQIEQTPATTKPDKQDAYWYRITYQN